MVKLTAELIQRSYQYINPCQDRELVLRGYKIAQIENLGATLDQFDIIDFSENDIRRLDGFPLLKRLKCLLLNHNRIVRIVDGLEIYLPNLECLVLTNNNIQELGDLDVLGNIPKLRSLSLMNNPVANKPYYRYYVAYRLRSVKLLDFRKIKPSFTEEADMFFKGKHGREVFKEIGKKTKLYTPSGNANNAKASNQTPQEIQKIREAIKNASTLQEVEKLTRMLQSGLIPGQKPLPPASQANGQQEEEEVETEPQNGS